jgi:hypothetical protein
VGAPEYQVRLARPEPKRSGVERLSRKVASPQTEGLTASQPLVASTTAYGTWMGDMRAVRRASQRPTTAQIKHGGCDAAAACAAPLRWRAGQLQSQLQFDRYSASSIRVHPSAPRTAQHGRHSAGTVSMPGTRATVPDRYVGDMIV